MNKLQQIVDRSKDLTKIAIVDSTRKITFGELDLMINGIANGLRSQGIGRLDRVGILASNSIEFVATYFGIVKLGATAVFLNTQLPQEKLEYIIAESNAKIIFTDTDIDLSHFPIQLIHFENIKSFVKDGDCLPYYGNNDPATIVYTSGSTGNPKGVMTSYKSHTWMIETRIRDLREGQRFIIATPCYHIGGLLNLEGAIAAHTELILLPKFNAKEYVAQIKNSKVEIVTGTPAMLMSIFNNADLLANSDFSSATQVRLASAPFTPSLVENIKKYIPNAKITNIYGLTECGGKIFDHVDGQVTPDLSVGYPVKDVTAKLVDNVLYVCSPAIALGYTNNNAVPTKDGFFNTKDLFRVDENGYYFYLGRSDDMFKSGGNTVYPRELEMAIETHPDVLSSAVVGVEDEIKGFKPHAFVIVKSGSAITEKILKDYAFSKLPYSICPRNIWILDKMPLNSVNKVDKKELVAEAKRKILCQKSTSQVVIN
jgi:acyl-CoA synthetase (AMP-forming)/AMP-acid ligase II